MKSYAITTEVRRRAAAQPYATPSEQNEAISTATARTFAILDLVAHAQAAVEVSSVIEMLALLMLAGLMVRSLLAVENVPVPFAPDRTLMLRIPLPDVRYPTPESHALFFREVLDRARAVVSWGATRRRGTGISAVPGRTCSSRPARATASRA